MLLKKKKKTYPTFNQYLNEDLCEYVKIQACSLQNVKLVAIIPLLLSRKSQGNMGKTI